MDSLEITLKIPDIWQQQALQALSDGHDVVVHAPTGAGKTFIFEQYVQRNPKRRAVYTVPTRALANDKYFEWQRQDMDVGIVTGDLSLRPDATLVVATLETQKGRLLAGQGPDLLVIDEYQMMGDPARGMNYELAIALTPPNTQLLLLSGSVGNPQAIVEWLTRIGRTATLVEHRERPVPQEEIMLEALPDRLPSSVKGLWPRLIGRALDSHFAPLLVFAPRRRAAEDLAKQLAAALPVADLLELTPEQRSLAGDPLQRLLRQRIAFHHSGLSYQQRAGLIEPLAKLGHLRVVVATTGLAAGINFCMKSVLVTDRDYQADHRSCQVRPDELLQMFGRAGRRGFDERGYILVAPGKPRLHEGVPLKLSYTPGTDWASVLAVMQRAVVQKQDPITTAEHFVQRLFGKAPLPLGFNKLKQPHGRNEPAPSTLSTQFITEILNSEHQWERQKGPVLGPLGEALAYRKGRWIPALQHTAVLAGIPVGSLCRIRKAPSWHYGREIPVATFPRKEGQSKVQLVKGLYKALQQLEPGRRIPRLHTLERLRTFIEPRLPAVTQGGKLESLVERNGLICARLDYQSAMTRGRRDRHGVLLIHPPTRQTELPPGPSFAALAGLESRGSTPNTLAELWWQLGLIHRSGAPTRRGVLSSFFNHAEGFAIAVALEDTSYAIDDLVRELANLRAGHRFEHVEGASTRLADLCRMHAGALTVSGYLNKGIPVAYGNGAAEVIAAIQENPARKHQFLTELLRPGDIQRAEMEWHSLLRQIANAPTYDWKRWMSLREAAHNHLTIRMKKQSLLQLPELTHVQRQRYQPRQSAR